jgi:hypothetical protein
MLSGLPFSFSVSGHPRGGKQPPQKAYWNSQGEHHDRLEPLQNIAAVNAKKTFHLQFAPTSTGLLKQQSLSGVLSLAKKVGAPPMGGELISTHVDVR